MSLSDLFGVKQAALISKRRTQTQRKRQRRLFLESLEDRRLLTTLATELISGIDGAGYSGNSFSNHPSVSDNGQFVAFRSIASDLVVGDTNNSYDVFVRDVTNGTTTLVSTDSNGVQGNSLSFEPSISDDGRYVAFSSYATNLVSGDTNNQSDIFVKDLQTGTTTLVSVDSIGKQGNNFSFNPSISGDGNYVVFISQSTNLDAADTDTLNDVYVRDLVNGTTTLVSTGSTGDKSNNSSYAPSISDDGRYVAFNSYATNLVSGDINNQADVFVKDLQTSITTLVSVDSNENQGNYHSSSPSISGDGKYVAFRSNSTNLDGGDTDTLNDMYVRDLVNGTTTLVSTSSTGGKSNNSSYAPSISDDGRYVAFWSDATNLVSGDINGRSDIFVKDLQTGTTTLVSVDSSGNQVNYHSYETSAAMSGSGGHVTFWSSANNLDGSDFNNTDDVFIRDLANTTTTLVSVRDPEIDIPGNNGSFTGKDIAVSEGGRFVAFQTAATNLFSDANGGHSDIVVRDRDDGSIILVSTDSNGVQGNSSSFEPSISDDGRYVAFSSVNNLVSGDINNKADVFVKDLLTGTTTLVSVDSIGKQGNNRSYNPSISGDGNYVAFLSISTNLDARDTDTWNDVYVRDLLNGTTTLVSTNSNGVKGNSGSYEPSISDDGRYVAFYSSASNLVSVDTNGRPDIFVKDLQTGTTTLVSVDSDEKQGNSSSHNPSISGDGNYVAFLSNSTNLDGGDTDTLNDVYVRDLGNGTTTLVSTSSTGGKSNNSSYEPSISDDGRYVAFNSYADNLVSGDINSNSDIFVKDLQTGTTTLVSTPPGGGQAPGTYFARQPSISGDGGYVAFTAYNLIVNSRNQVYLSAPVNKPPTVAVDNATVTVYEGSTVTNSGTFNDSDLGDNVTISADIGTISSQDNGNSGNWTWQLPTSDNITTTTVTITADDGNGGVTSTTFDFTVDNAAPHDVVISASVGELVFAVGSTQTFAGSFKDVSAADTHANSGTYWTFTHLNEAGTLVTEKHTANVTQGSGSGTVSNDFSFTGAGVYTATLTVTDDDGGVTTSATSIFVVYDPSAGFVTGGGWIDSPAGADQANPTATGKANFGFVSKYKKGADVPDGETQFQFKAGNLNFHSTAYEWLVVAGADAKFKGDGTINGAGNYGFMLTATDGQVSGGGGTDTFRIKIWDKDAGDAVVYDNQTGEADDGYAGTGLGGGSIVIHSKGSALHVGGAAITDGSAAELRAAQLEPAIAEAIELWAASGVTLDQLYALSQVDVQLADFSGELLGMASPANIIWIDVDAAGYGWDVNFVANGVDLVSVVAHELGHILGLDDITNQSDVMGSHLLPGVERLPTKLSLQAVHVDALLSQFGGSVQPYPLAGERFELFFTDDPDQAFVEPSSINGTGSADTVGEKRFTPSDSITRIDLIFSRHKTETGRVDQEHEQYDSLFAEELNWLLS